MLYGGANIDTLVGGRGVDLVRDAVRFERITGARLAPLSGRLGRRRS
ncbi:MAG: hypothetical protein R3C15_12790 [Thermoleophilia bacterium]